MAQNFHFSEKGKLKSKVSFQSAAGGAAEGHRDPSYQVNNHQSKVYLSQKLLLLTPIAQCGFCLKSERTLPSALQTIAPIQLLRVQKHGGVWNLFQSISSAECEKHSLISKQTQLNLLCSHPPWRGLLPQFPAHTSGSGLKCSMKIGLPFHKGSQRHLEIYFSLQSHCTAFPNCSTPLAPGARRRPCLFSASLKLKCFA